MSNKINVEEILHKHLQTGEWDTYDIYREEGTSGLPKAIKEIVEAVVDRCAEEQKLQVRLYNSKTEEIKFEEPDTVYWEGHPEDQSYPDLQVEVYKESILQVKQMVNYF